MSDNENNMPLLDFPVVKNQMDGIIKVIGVGGGGCNAVRNMYDEGGDRVQETWGLSAVTQRSTSTALPASGMNA